MIDRRLRDRYSRQTMFPGIGEEGQAKLQRGKVVVVGCGALGGNIANLLVRAGVGRVTIVDRDFIEQHNLQRQVLFDENDIEQQLPKAVAAERHLRAVNSSVTVEGIVADVNYTNIERFVSGADVILDGLDNPDTRLLINDAALKHKIPWVYGGAISSTGMTMTIVPGQTPCFRCVFAGTAGPGPMLTCETAGVVGTVPAVVASLQATEAIKILVGSGELNRDLISVDVWKNDFSRLRVKRREDCPACQGRYEFLEAAFEVRVSSLCGQSRAVQVVDTRVKQVDLEKLAERLKKAGKVSYNEFMLWFIAGEHEIAVFPDGRAIVKGTLDESLARALYTRYVAGLA